MFEVEESQPGKLAAEARKISAKNPGAFVSVDTPFGWLRLDGGYI